MPNTEVVDRILAQVAKRGRVRIPDGVDRRKLAKDLAWAANWSAVLRDTGSDALAKRRFDALVTLTKTSKKLCKLIEQDDLIAASLSLDVHRPSLTEIHDSLSYLAEAAGKEITRRRSAGLTHRGAFKLREHKNPTDFLVGRLARIAHEHLGIKAAVSRPQSGGRPDGPFVRFCEAFAKEMDIRLSGETVAKALRSNPLFRSTSATL